MRRYAAIVQYKVPNYGEYILGFTNFSYPYNLDNLSAIWVHDRDADWCSFDDTFVRNGESPSKFRMDLGPVYRDPPIELDPIHWCFKEVSKAEYLNGIFLMKIPELVTLSDG